MSTTNHSLNTHFPGLVIAALLGFPKRWHDVVTPHTVKHVHGAWDGEIKTIIRFDFRLFGDDHKKNSVIKY